MDRPGIQFELHKFSVPSVQLEGSYLIPQNISFIFVKDIIMSASGDYYGDKIK